MQAEMMHSQKEPAAKTTRVGRVDKGSASREQESIKELSLEHVLPIVGDVRERMCGLASEVPGVEMKCSPAEAGFPRATHRSKSKFKFGREERRRHDAIKDIESQVNGDDDVGKESDAILGDMSMDEIESARKELLSRLPQKTVEFLKQRGVQKSRTSHDTAMNASGSRKSLAERQTQTAAVSHRAEASAAPRQRESLPILQRLRFNISGDIVSVLPESTDQEALHASTLQRDLVRQAEGSVDNSSCYTLMQAKILARSTDFNQRAIGLRYLGNILRTCKNHMWEDDGVIDLSNLGDGSLPNTALSWLNIWQHAIYSVQVTKVIRYAMDESKINVLTEACRALVALVGLPEIAERLLNNADMNPSIGIPKCQVCHMQRSDTNQWVSMPLDILDQKEIYGTEDMETDEQDLARIDPISGMVNMRIFPRMCYLLQKDTTIGMNVKNDLVLALLGFVMAGKQVGHAMVQTPHLVDILISLLPKYTTSHHMEETSLLSVDVLCVLLDYVDHWGDEKLSQKLSNFAMNALLSWRKESGTCESFQAIMKLWRSLKHSGKMFTSFDDIYQHLCFYMFPDIVKGQSYSGHLCVIGGREAFLTAAACASVGHISPSCTSSILKDVYRWLKQLPCLTFGELFAFENDVLSMIGAVLHFLQTLLQTKRIWEEEEEFKLAQNAIRDLVEDISQMLILTDDVPKAFWEEVTACTCRMGILSTFMNLIYLLDSKVLQNTSMPRKMLESISQIHIVPMTDFEILQPWDMKMQQHYLQIARLADSIEMNMSHNQDMDLITQVNLRLVSSLPPGSESIGLRLVSLMFGDCAKYFIQRGLSEMNSKAIQYKYITSIPSSSQENMDEMRVQALHGLSTMMGYELQDASGWNHVKGVRGQYTQVQTILNGEESMFPLADTWIFSASINTVEMPLLCYQGILTWILGMETDGVLQYLGPGSKHLSLVKSLFDRRNKQDETVFMHDSIVRLLGSVLLGSYMTSILSIKEFQPAWTLQHVRHITENYVTESFGDLFFGMAIVNLFCDQIVSPEWQEEVLSLLKDGMALQYLPTCSEYPNDIEQQLAFSMHDDEKKSTMKLQFLLDIIASDAFARALEAESLSVDIIMHHVLRATKESSPECLKPVSKRLERYKSLHWIEHALKYLDM